MPTIFPIALRQVIINKIVTPLFNHHSTVAWDREVASRIVNNNFEPSVKNYHRNTILQQGQADFTQELNGLTTDDLVLLYTFYYFQMHFSSSVTLFQKYSDTLIDVFRTSNQIILIDVGCGPFTSGLSFLDFTRLAEINGELNSFQKNVRLEYFGVDNANSMTAMGRSILNDYQTTINDGGFLYHSIDSNHSYQNIPHLIGSRDKQTTIIINCCYFFASQSINVIDFTAAIQTLINNNPNSKIMLFYQNAPSNLPRIIQNYRTFKQTINGLSHNGTEIEELQFNFNDEFQATNYITLNREVKCQMLKNY